MNKLTTFLTASFCLAFHLASSQCSTTAPAGGTISSTGIPSTAGLTWSTWTTAPTGCPTSPSSTQITGNSYTMDGAPNKPLFYASGTVGGTVNLPSNNDKANIVVCPGAVLTLSRGTMNATDLNILVMAGGTLRTSSSSGFPGNHFLYGAYIPATNMTIQDANTNYYIASTGILQLASNLTTSNSLTLNSSSIGIYSEGTIDVYNLQLNSAPSPFLCLNNASSCTRIRGTYNTSNSNDQIAAGTAGGYLKLDLTSGSVTFNNRVTSSSTLKVCTYGTTTYCRNGGGSCCTSTCATQSTSAFPNTAYNTSCSSLPSTCNIPLSIRLLYFKAKMSSEGVMLRWVAALEDNTKAYRVERSTDGSSWASIGEVEVTGNTQGYDLLDRSAPNGYVYYRLVEIDKSGKETIHSIEVIQIEKEDITFRLYPNPNKGSFTVEISGEFPQYTMELVDVTGKKVGTYTLLAGSNTISDIAASGLYFAMLKIKNEMKIQRLIVQK